MSTCTGVPVNELRQPPKLTPAYGGGVILFKIFAYLDHHLRIEETGWIELMGNLESSWHQGPQECRPHSFSAGFPYEAWGTKRYQQPQNQLSSVRYFNSFLTLHKANLFQCERLQRPNLSSEQLFHTFYVFSREITCGNQAIPDNSLLGSSYCAQQGIIPGLIQQKRVIDLRRGGAACSVIPLPIHGSSRNTIAHTAPLALARLVSCFVLPLDTIDMRES